MRGFWRRSAEADDETEDRRRADAPDDRRGGGHGRRSGDWERVVADGGAGQGARYARQGAFAAAAFAGGLALGAAVWDRVMAGSRRGLFSPHPMSRYHAVSYLAARPSVDTARLLRDYVRWESHPLLRRRARRILRAVEASL